MIIPCLSVRLSVFLSFSDSITGILEEREGQRPPVSHRGVSPEGQCLLSLITPLLKTGQYNLIPAVEENSSEASIDSGRPIKLMSAYSCYFTLQVKWMVHKPKFGCSNYS